MTQTIQTPLTRPISGCWRGVWVHRRNRCAEPNGFTIIEVTLAVVLLAVIMGAVAAVLASMIRHGQSSTSRTVASSLVGEEIAKVRQSARTNFGALPQGQVVSTTTLDGVPYTVTRDSQFVAESSTEDVCSSTGSVSAVAFLRIKVLVAWPGMQRGESPAHAETLIAPPPGGLYSDKGHLAVTARTAAGAGSSGVPVSIFRGATLVSRIATTTDGCAFFAYLDPGTYTVSVDRSGYVDGQNRAVATSTAVVSAGTKTSADFDYDRGATISGDLADATGGASPTPVGTGMTIANPALTPGGTQAFAASGTSRSRSIAVFPYSDGYRLWGGSCADADPGIANRPGPVGVQAGRTTSSAPIGLAAQPVQVVILPADERLPAFPRGPVRNAAIQLVHAPMSGCPAGETLTYDATALTDLTGTVRLAMPLGTWTVQVINTGAGGPYRPSGAAWPTVTLTGSLADPARASVVVAVR